MRYLQKPTLLFLIALLLGFFLGTITPVQSATGNFFAGYMYVASINGASAQIKYTNPGPVNSGFSTEWVMAGSYSGSSPYIQSGWMKRTGHSYPEKFTEYPCSNGCRKYWGEFSSGTSTYKVEYVSPNWNAYIDGVVKDSVSASTLGMTTAEHSIYSGETSDDTNWLGGTSTNPLTIQNLSFKNTGGTWYQVNTNNLGSITTSGTYYHAVDGYTSPYTWVDNWTVFP